MKGKYEKLVDCLDKRGYLNQDLVDEIEQIYGEEQLSIHGVMCSFVDELRFNLDDLTKDRDYWLKQKQYEKAISILTCIEQIKQVLDKYENYT